MAKTREDSQPLDTRTIPLDLDDTRVSARTGQRRVLASDTQGTTEPSPREVNRQIRDQMKAQRLLDATKSRGAGSGLEVLGRVQRKHPKNPKAQVAMFFHEFVIKAGTGRSRPVSDRTRSVYGDGIIRMIDDLRADRAAIQNLGELGKAHVLRLIQYWGRQGQSAATVQNKISILRRFLTFIGKPSIIPKGHELKQWLNHQGIEAQITRQSVATTSKAWSDMDIDFHDVLIRLREISAITAMQLEVQAAFGLRMKESLQLNPKAADYGNSLRIIHGTKGGLPRDIDFDPEPEVSTWQRDVLERAKVFAEKNRKGTLSIPGKSLEQSKAHFYYQIRKVGVTRDQLGVTAHGLPLTILHALRFYAGQQHFVIDPDHQDFDTVSGEPQNWLMSEKEDDSTMIEDGSIARLALQGVVLNFEELGEEGGGECPKPVEGEIYVPAPQPAAASLKNPPQPHPHAAS